MTDGPHRPDDETPPDDTAADDLAGDDDAVAEPGLVVEGDEIDVDDEAESESDDGSDEDPEPDDAFTDDEVEDVLDDGDDPADGEPELDEADDEADEAEEAEEDLAIPAGAFSDDADDDEPLDRPLAEEPIAEEPAGEAAADKPSSHRGRYALLALVLIAGGLYVVGYVLTGTRMPANATIGGVDVSGMSPAAARVAVDSALSPNSDREIVLTSGKKEFRIKPGDAGLALDVERSVAQAGGRRSWDPRDMVALFTGDHATAPALDVDDAKLQSAIGTISESVNEEVVEAQITFRDSKPVPREPRSGRVVSKSATADAIQAAYLVDDRPVKVPTVAVEPAVDSDGLKDAVTTIAEPAVSGPVTLRVGEKKVSLPVTAFAPALVIRVEQGRLVPHLDAKKLAGPLTDSTTGIGKKAVDATVKIEKGKAVVVPGKEGVGLQPKEMAIKLVPALTKKGADRSVKIEAKVVEPLFTTKDAKALRITEKISEFETEFPYAEYRNTNQGRAAELINGTIIKPGETFSFNTIVGERTVANGFVTGTVINGGVFREELGGGVSQVATTTYNAAFFGGMDDTEHHPHAFYINRYPVGREATVYFGSLDLRWKNPTKYGVLVRSYVDKSTPSSPGRMHVELWSTKIYDVKAGLSAKRNPRSPGTQYDDTDKCVPQDPIPGFDIDVYRTFYKGGTKVKSETDTATYQAADHVICGKKPK